MKPHSRIIGSFNLGSEPRKNSSREGAVLTSEARHPQSKPTISHIEAVCDQEGDLWHIL